MNSQGKFRRGPPTRSWLSPAGAADRRVAATDGDIPCRFLPYMRRRSNTRKIILSSVMSDSRACTSPPCSVRLPGFDLHSGASTPASTPTTIGTVVMPMARHLHTRSHAISCMLPTLAYPDHPMQAMKPIDALGIHERVGTLYTGRRGRARRESR